MVLSLSLRILCVLCVSAVLLNDSSKNRRDAENAEMFLIRLVMNVHRLDTDAPWSSHAREVHTRAAKETSG